jgi:hypothetical protein
MELTEEQRTLLLGLLHFACETSAGKNDTLYRELVTLRMDVWRTVPSDDADRAAAVITNQLHSLRFGA